VTAAAIKKAGANIMSSVAAAGYRIEYTWTMWYPWRI